MKKMTTARGVASIFSVLPGLKKIHACLDHP